MRLIDADAYSAEMKDRQDAAWKWRNEAIAEEDEVKLARAEGAFTAFTEAKLTMDKHIISPWHRVDDGLPKPFEMVIAYVDPWHIFAAYHNGHGDWKENDGFKVIGVRYWMPIKPPTETERSEK